VPPAPGWIDTIAPEPVVLARQQALLLERVHVALDPLELARQLGEQALVAFGFAELEHLLDRAERRVARGPVLDRAPRPLQRGDVLLRLVGTVPEAGLTQLGLEGLHFLVAAVDVKGTSAGRRAERARTPRASGGRRLSAWSGVRSFPFR
jgi:hypothetical protein